MKLITWNICCLPKYLNFYHNPVENIFFIIETLLSYGADVICLQEVFDQTIVDILKQKFQHHTIVKDTCKPYIGVNSGLVTISKYPIIETKFIEYTDSFGEDWLSFKGLLFSIIQYKKKQIAIVNTHLNNSSPMFRLFDNSQSIFTSQFNQLLTFVYNRLRKYSYVLVAGDLNQNTTYIQKELLNSFFKHLLQIDGFATAPTSREGKILDHILIVSKEDHRLQSTTNISFTNYSDHALLVKQFNI